MSNSKKDMDEEGEEIGQGKLYSPEHARKVDKSNVNLVYGDIINNRNNNNNSSSDDNENLEESNNNKEEKIKSSVKEGNYMVSGGEGMDMKNKMGTFKDVLMKKLMVASVPSDASENIKHFLETVVEDVTMVTQGITKDVLGKIKAHLAHILPSLSSSLTSKMVDDAEKEASRSDKPNKIDNEGNTQKEEQKGTMSSLFPSYITKSKSKL